MLYSSPVLCTPPPVEYVRKCNDGLDLVFEILKCYSSLHKPGWAAVLLECKQNPDSSMTTESWAGLRLGQDCGKQARRVRSRAAESVKTQP